MKNLIIMYIYNQKGADTSGAKWHQLFFYES